jgi:hypothetical protein
MAGDKCDCVLSYQGTEYLGERRQSAEIEDIKLEKGCYRRGSYVGCDLRVD